MKNRKQKQNADLIYRHWAIRDEERKINEDNRSLIMPVSSEFPVERWEGIEVLSHDADAVDLSRFLDGAPLLLDHDWGCQIGVIERAWIENKRLWVEVRFGKGATASEVWQDVVDKIRRNVSIGYKEEDRAKDKDGKNKYILTRWMPYELSITSVAADPTVGVGRSLDENGEHEATDADGLKSVDGNVRDDGRSSEGEDEDPKTQRKVIIMEENKTHDHDKLQREFEDKAREQARAEKSRIAEILAIGNKFGLADKTSDAISNDMSVDQFRQLAIEKLQADNEALKVRNEPVGMNQDEKRQYSFIRAIMAQVPNSGVDAGLEMEASKAYAQKIGRDAKGMWIPPDVVSGNERVFNQTTGAGSNLIATDLRPDMFIDILRNRTVLINAGAMLMPGLVGNVAIPRQTGTATSYWFNAESADITDESNPTVDQVALTPRTTGAYTNISRSLLKQGTPEAEQLVRNDLAAVIALSIDRAGLAGTGAPQPTGIINTGGINAANWATANTPTWGEIVAMESAVDLQNALDGEFVYVMGAGLRGALKTIVKAAGQGGFIVGDDGRMNGYRVIVSNQLAPGQCIFGRFADLIVGMWGGLDIQANPFVGELRGALRITTLQDVDIALRRAQSFTYNSNSAPTT